MPMTSSHTSPAQCLTLALLPLALSIATASQAAENMVALEEVIVTAQKRDESVQQVPIAITAMTGDMLDQAGVRDISQINTVSPSVQFTKTNNAAASSNLQIRGIGTVGNAKVFEGAVGVFIDGVYRSRSGAALSDLLDIESLEVLRGPQGTLFGKNTSAGAITIRSKAPDIGVLGGNYQVTFGNYNEQIFKGALNLPVTENSAVRLAAISNRREGFIESDDTGDDYNDVDRQSFKLQYLIEPSDSLAIKFIADYSAAREDCCYGTVSSVNGPTAPIIQVLSAFNGYSFPLDIDEDEYEKTLNRRTDQVIRDRGVALDIAWEINDTTALRSITGWRVWNLTQDNTDADFSPADILTLDEDFGTDGVSQEFVLNGEIDSLPLFEAADYVVGAYYANEDLEAKRVVGSGAQANVYWNVLLTGDPSLLLPGATLAPLAPPGIWSIENFEGNDEVYAAFTHWNLHINDAWKILAGVRYSAEEKDGSFRPDQFSFPVFMMLGLGPTYAYEDSIKDEAVTGTLGFQYTFDYDMMAYGTYSRGFKSGGVNLDLNAGGVIPGPQLDPTYKPEYVDNYELGLKADYWDGRGRTNVALFYSELEDLQFAVFKGTFFTVENAAKARVHGVEVENTFALTEGLQAGLAVTYLDTGFNGEASGILANRDFVESPHIAGTATLNYETPLTDALVGYTAAALNYRGERYTNTGNNAQADETTLFDLVVGVKAVNELWDISAWCRNCGDERYLEQHFNTVFQEGSINGYPGAPRQYGVTLKGRY